MDRFEALRHVHVAAREINRAQKCSLSEPERKQLEELAAVARRSAHSIAAQLDDPHLRQLLARQREVMQHDQLRLVQVRSFPRVPRRAPRRVVDAAAQPGGLVPRRLARLAPQRHGRAEQALLRHVGGVGAV